MHPSPFVESVLVQILSLAFIVVATTLLVLRHQKRQLNRLAIKQRAVIGRMKEKLEALTQGTGTDLHARDTLEFLQTQYQQRYSQIPEVPARASDEGAFDQIVMAAALRTVAGVLQAKGDSQPPAETWENVRRELVEILGPPCTATQGKEGAQNPGASDSEDAFPSSGGPPGLQSQALQSFEETTGLLDRLAQMVHDDPALQALNPLVQQTRDGLQHLGDILHAPTGRRARESSNAEIGEVTRRALLDSLSKNNNEIKTLRNRMAQQMEMVAKLKYRLAGTQEEDQTQLHHEIDQLTRMLSESDTCISVLEMEVENAHKHAHELEAELARLQASAAQTQPPEGTAALAEPAETNDETKEALEREVAGLKHELAATEKEYETLHARYRELKEEYDRMVAAGRAGAH